MRYSDKAKEIKLLREDEIRDDVRRSREKFMLEKAREMLQRDGFQALNLPELAKLSGYSKPTIYKYFPCKEDLMVALAIESTERQIGFMEIAVTFDGRPRERLCGIHALNHTVVHEAMLDRTVVQTNRICSSASAEHRRTLDALDEKRIGIMSGLIREAMECGDLKPPAGVDEYQLLFTLMSTEVGGHFMEELQSPVMEKWFKKINFMHGAFGRIVLDGIGWRPLSNERDYGQTLKRFFRDLFPDLLDHPGVVDTSIG